MSESTALVRLVGSRWALPAMLFAASAAIALLGSWNVSIWNDEAVTISAATRTLPELWALLQRIDAVHGLYYAFMNLWVDVLGASPFSLRLPSALAAGGTTVGVYFVTRIMATQQTALVAAVVCATLPRLIWGGIEARSFIFSALAAVWAGYFLLRAIERGRWTAWLAYGVVAAVGVLFNIYLVLLVIAHAITVVIRARHDRVARVGFVLSAAAVAVATVPFLLLVRSQQAQLGDAGDRSPMSIARKLVINQFFLGETPDPEASTLWWTRAWQAAAIIAAALGVVAMCFAIVRRAQPGDSKRDVLALTLPWIIVPSLLVALYAVAVSPIYQPRYFTFTAPAAAMLIALGLRAVGRRWPAVVGVVVYAACILIIAISQRTPFAKSGSDWSAVAGFVAEHAEPGDAVYFAPRHAEEQNPVEHTTRRIAEAYADGFRGLTDLTLEHSGAETGRLDGFSRLIADAQDGILDHDRVWAVFSRKSPAEVRTDSDELFGSLGYEADAVWSGPSTLIVEYTRSAP